MKIYRAHFCAIAVLSLFLSTSSAYSRGHQRSFMVSLPLILGSPLGLSYNLGNQAALTLEMTSEGEHDILSKKELESDPDSSLTVRSQEFGLSLSRYSNAHNMSGWHWSLGAGYRTSRGAWIKKPSDESQSGFEENPLYNNQGQLEHYYMSKGATVNGRLGYRYVAEELGFAASLFFLLKHFQNKVSPNKDLEEYKESGTEISYEDSTSLRRRLTTRLSPGIEIGWAF